MRKLMAQLTSRHNLLRPTHDQWIADAAAVRVLLVASQRCVGRHGPSMREIRMGFRAADLVDTRELLGKGFGARVARTMRIHETERAAFLACAIVGCDDHNRVRQHIGVLEEADEAGKVLVRMIEHCGIRSLEAREDALFIRAVVLPSLYAGIARRQARRRRHDTHCLLSGDPAFALNVPAALEDLVVALD